jgi:hypothetical protein
VGTTERWRSGLVDAYRRAGRSLGRRPRMTPLPDRARVVVVGGGITGTSVA